VNTLTVTLKQHTPLIHFQHAQEDATLRATEVKPKLDRFILTKLGNGDYEKGKAIAKEKNWLVGKGDKPALNYKMRITAETVKTMKMPVEKKMKKQEGTKDKVQDKDKQGNLLFVTTFPLILSNMGGKTESDLINFSYADKIDVFVNSIKNDLKEYLDNNIIEFFMLNNFGQRNNKGFGSFNVIRKNKEEVKFSDAFFDKNVQRLKFSLPVSQNIDYFKKIFEVIDYYWKRLKPGINYFLFDKKTNQKKRIEYKKSFLYQYINDYYDRNWEKRKIKEFFHLGNRHTDDRNSKTPTFARALLGMPDKFEYRNKYGNKITVSISHSEIERIMSPITFKPIIDGDSVTIFILIKDEHFAEIKPDTKDFKFSKDGKSMTLPLNFNIDYCDLLKKYGEYFQKENKENGKAEFYPIRFNGSDILEENSVKIFYL
jgi:hypothetical protein